LERLEALDRVVEILAAVQVVLGARGDHEMNWTAMGYLDSRGDALGRELERIYGVILIAAEVLDRASGESRAQRLLDRFGHAFGLVGERVLEISRDREARRL